MSNHAAKIASLEKDISSLSHNIKDTQSKIAELKKQKPLLPVNFIPFQTMPLSSISQISHHIYGMADIQINLSILDQTLHTAIKTYREKQMV